jgi:phenylalanyl-tRNA synthetase beta chain
MMKLSYNWLCDFVDLADISLEDLAHMLTMSAFEVEDISSTKKLLDQLVVLGEIKEITKHPDADKLRVTRTEVAQGQILQIVCGAGNIAVGQRVPVALVGACVTNRHDGSELKIKESKIRGVESFGMLCSADELGFSQEEVQKIKSVQSDGIFLLYDPNNNAIQDQASTCSLGTTINEVLNIKPDFIIEVGARSNRGDALSVLGQAREISAILSKPLNMPKDLDPVAASNIIYDESLVSVKPLIASSAEKKDCSLFYTVSIENIKIEQSPQWLKDRLNAMGTKSINNVVDISNYVLLEMGQPMHFYDRDKIQGGYLEVRRANPGETLLTLEQKNHKLEKTNLVIADASGPCSLAGVMGGMDSSINDQTKNIVIEVAVFDPAVVRRSSRSAGVESESKRRFERGVDRAGSKRALLRAIELLSLYASSPDQKIKLGKILLAGSEDIPQKTVSLKTTEVKRYLGLEISADTVVEILSRLGFDLLERGESLKFSIPSFRQLDINREIDLIEEIGRLYGFDKIPVQVPPLFISSPNTEVYDLKKSKTKIRETLMAFGFYEAQLSSLIGDSLLNLDEKSVLLSPFAVPDKSKSHADLMIEMDNPLSREHRLLRQSLMPGLIQSASRNYSYDKSSDIKLFEIGKIYNFLSLGSDLNSFKEEPGFSAILVKSQGDWTQAKPKTLAENFFQMKSILENLFAKVKFLNLDEQSKSFSFLHPGISARVMQGKKQVAVIGKLHPSICKEWDLPLETYVLESVLPNISQAKFKPVPNTPSIERDITVDSSDLVNASDIEAVIEKFKSKNLKNLSLTSFYRPESSPDGSLQKSTTFRLKWQSDTETLNGSDIDADVVAIKALLAKELQVSFRA